MFDKITIRLFSVLALAVTITVLALDGFSGHDARMTAGAMPAPGLDVALIATATPTTGLVVQDTGQPATAAKPGPALAVAAIPVPTDNASDLLQGKPLLPTSPTLQAKVPAPPPARTSSPLTLAMRPGYSADLVQGYWSQR